MKGMHVNGIPARTLDVLETDGGWLTADGLSVALDAGLPAVERALWRLRQRALVEYRSVPLALMRPKSGDYSGNKRGATKLDTRGEWRFLSWGDYDD